jgi:N-carbamoyl-L-amino-acid hydrolase
MLMRRDAGAAALKFGAMLSESLYTHGSPDIVWNVASAIFKPGAFNVVPSEAELVLQFRDPSEERLENLERLAREMAKRCAKEIAVEVDIKRLLHTRP